MRIIAGDFKKRRLQGPPDDTVTRPIPDIVKESLFNILRGHCEDGPVLDCFAGTGSIGLEALSRGATHCTFVERDKKIAQILKANIDHCNAADRAELVVGDALGPGALSRCPRPLHLIFFDPPYPLVRDKASFARVKAQLERAIALLDDTGYAVLRTPWPLFHDDAPAVQTPEADDAPPERLGKRSRRSSTPPSEDRSSSRAAKRGRHATDADAGRRGPEHADDPDDMEEIEIDLSTPEGQALLQQLMDAGAIDPADEGEEVDSPDDTLDVHDAAASGDPDGPGTPARGRDAAESPRPVVRLVPRTPGRRADLSIPGAVGPETHPYSGMAVHLYMKARH